MNFLKLIQYIIITALVVSCNDSSSSTESSSSPHIEKIEVCSKKYASNNEGIFAAIKDNCLEGMQDILKTNPELATTYLSFFEGIKYATPLFYSLYLNRPKLSIELTKYNVNPDFETDTQCRKIEYGSVCYGWESIPYLAIKNGDINVFKTLFNKGMKITSYHLNRIGFKNYDFFEFLIKDTKIPVSEEMRKDILSKTIGANEYNLMLAYEKLGFPLNSNAFNYIQSDNLEIAKYIYNKFGYPDYQLRSSTTSVLAGTEYCSIKHEGVKQFRHLLAYPKIMKYLIGQGEQVSEAHFFVNNYSNNVEVFDGLIELGFDPLKTKTGCGRGIAFEAFDSSYRQFKIAKRILAIPGIDFYEKDDFGIRPIDVYPKTLGAFPGGNLDEFKGNLNLYLGLTKDLNFESVDGTTLLINLVRNNFNFTPEMLDHMIIVGLNLEHINSKGDKVINHVNEIDQVKTLVDRGVDLHYKAPSGENFFDPRDMRIYLYAVDHNYEMSYQFPAEKWALKDSSLGKISPVGAILFYNKTETYPNLRNGINQLFKELAKKYSKNKIKQMLKTSTNICPPAENWATKVLKEDLGIVCQ
jgi:hypothetical protein